MKRRYFYIFLFMLVLFTSIFWIVEIMNGSIPLVDRWTRGFSEKLAYTKFYLLFRWLTELGSGTFLTPFAIIMGIILWRVYRDWLVGLMFGAGCGISYLVNIVIKVIVERERPRILIAAEAEGYSFPSGHAMISLVCYGLVSYFFTKKLVSQKAIITLQVCLFALIFLIGMSRYVISVHYLTDVLAGFVFGALFLFGWIKLYELIKRNRIANSR